MEKLDKNFFFIQNTYFYEILYEAYFIYSRFIYLYFTRLYATNTPQYFAWKYFKNVNV